MLSPNRISASPDSNDADSIIYPPSESESDSDSSDEYASSDDTASKTFVVSQDIPGRRRSLSPPHQLSTPSLTPDDSDEDEMSSSGTQSKDALDFLLTLFPHNGAEALPYAKGVTISAPDLGNTFEGVVLELPGKPKALYVDGKSAHSVSLRERYSSLSFALDECHLCHLLSIVALMDLADECFQCSALVIALDRSSTALGDILHSFMYVGGNVVTKPPFQVDPRYLLVGMEI